MKKLLLVMALVLICSTAQAAPFLVCDWQDGVISSQVEVNGTILPGKVVQRGAEMILLDLQGYANGAYTFRARFIGTGGFPSEWSVPFSAA